MKVTVVLAAGALLVLAVSGWAAPAGSRYFAAVREDAPLVYYGFDDSAGPVVADLSGNGRNGAYGNKFVLGQTSASPGLGSAVSFGGGSVAVPALGKLPQLSLEYWIKPASLGGLRSLYTVDGWYPAALHNQLFDAADRLSVSGNGGGDDRDFAGIVPDAWQHVVLTYDSAARTVIEYVDGLARTAQTWTAAQAPVLNPAHIGQWLSGSYQRPYLGAMDEFAVYGKVLSPDRVRAHFFAASYDNLVRSDSPRLYYRLNEASGATVARDASGGGGDGAATNVVFGTVGVAPGRGASAGFNNADSNIVVPPLGTMAKLSIEIWLRPKSAAADLDTIFNVRVWTGGAVHFQLRGGRLQFSVFGSPDLLFGSPQDVPLGAWTHVVATYDSSSGAVSVYANGKPLGTQAAAAKSPVNLTAADVGAWNGSSRAFDGQMAELAVYDYVLSPAQVSGHYAAGSEGRDSSQPAATSPAAAVSPPASAKLADRSVPAVRLQTNYGHLLVSGELQSTDGIRDGTYTDTYEYAAAAGETLKLDVWGAEQTASGEPLPPLTLAVAGPDGKPREVGRGPGWGRFRATASTAGVYTFRVAAADPAKLGRYYLSLNGKGLETTGTLEAGDKSTRDGYPYDEVKLEAREDGLYAVVLHSDDFVGELAVQDASGQDLASAQGAAGANPSMAPFLRAGSYRVIVYGDGIVGGKWRMTIDWMPEGGS